MPRKRIKRYLRHGTLPQLALFEAAARLASITRAADELHISQSAASIQLKKLAEVVGVPLFEHVGRGVRLTPAGERLAGACGDLFDRFEQLDDTLANQRAPAHARLRLVTATSGGQYAVSANG
jgi:DNA-binding transcriptional LysR family regulator